MDAVVLESFVGSDYEDSPSSYEFPTRYLRLFEPLSRGEAMVAVIYEPRGTSGGRMAYVGWASLKSPPVESARRGARGEQLWIVHYATRYRDFDRIVPRQIHGEPVETWLRALQPGRSRNVATVGRAVRRLSPEDLQAIFEFGFASELDVELRYPAVGDRVAPELKIQERATRLVAAAQREARFRDDVLAGYARRCAITGFTAGTRSPSRMFGLLDAAHIRPVWAQGPDTVANGIALTPTVHRLFDRGLFTIRYEGDRPEVLLSPRIEEGMVLSQDSASRLALTNGSRLLLPDTRDLWPHPDALAYHQMRVFLRG